MRPTSLPGNKKKALGFCFVQILPIQKKTYIYDWSHKSVFDIISLFVTWERVGAGTLWGYWWDESDWELTGRDRQVY